MLNVRSAFRCISLFINWTDIINALLENKSLGFFHYTKKEENHTQVIPSPSFLKDPHK